jgi:hypothetical protein
MTVNHQPTTGDVAQAYLKHRRFLPATREGWHSSGWKRRSQQIMMILTMVGTVLFFWTQPVAAASTITEFHVSNVGVPQGIAAGSDGNLWFTYQDFTTNVSAIGRITTS